MQNPNSSDRDLQNRLEWLKEELNRGNISPKQLELAAYLGDLEAKTLVDVRESPNPGELRSWLYGLNMGGKAALVRICCPFARDCLSHWHSCISDWHSDKNRQTNGNMEWFDRLPREEWFENFSKAVEVAESWVLQPSRESVRLATKLQHQLYDILCQIDLLCSEGDFPDEGLYIAQVAYYTIGATAWTVDEATADYIESGQLAEVEAIANAGPAYEMVETVTIANKILKQKDDDIRARIQGIYDLGSSIPRKRSDG